MKTPHNRTGFSLVELMMSLGILVVGLSMVATAFPTAMLANKLSVADTSATMISENAAAICRIKLSHETIEGLVGVALSDHTARIDETHTGDLTHPVNDTESCYGWLLAARQYDDNNDYQLIVVPYRKFLPTDTASAFSDVTVNDLGEGVGNQITSGNKSVGSPVISKTDGTFAYVLDSAGNLSRKITSGAALAVGDNAKDSPAIGCYVIRTSVRP